MRILVLEDNETDALAIQRELGSVYDVTIVSTLADALLHLRISTNSPDVIVTDLSLPDSDGMDTVRALHEVAGVIPIIISTGILTERLREQIKAVGPAAQLHDKNEGLALLRALLDHQRVVQERLDSTRQELFAEIDQVAARAAEQAVKTAIEQLISRLHLNDEEGLRMAIRLAKAWEVAKSRFLIAVTNGLVAALLIALGAGIVAMVKNGHNR